MLILINGVGWFAKTAAIIALRGGEKSPREGEIRAKRLFYTLRKIGALTAFLAALSCWSV